MSYALVGNARQTSALPRVASPTFPLSRNLTSLLIAIAFATGVFLGHARPFARTGSRPSFYEIARKHGTDKVTTHHYDAMYDKYLEPLRDRPLKMLEIGLGCDMKYGPGKSLHTWLEFLPNVELSFLEYDAACAAKWRSRTPAKIYTGDQANVQVLQEIVASSGKTFDVIVDDGGHTMQQQQVSFSVLFDQALKPGGIYFIEDLQTSYWAEYGGGKANSTMEMVKKMLDDLNVFVSGKSRQKYTVLPTRTAVSVLSIDCMEEICAFTKRKGARRPTYD